MEKSLNTKEEITMITGTYQHYKGGIYEVLGVGKQSETMEDLVLYKGQDGKLWARPKELFNGYALVNGEQIKRFVKIG